MTWSLSRAHQTRLRNAALAVAGSFVLGATSSDAQPASASSPGSAMVDVLDTPAFHAEVQRQQQQNALAAASAKVQQVFGSQAIAPKLSELGSELRGGSHNVVTKDGERIVWLIRSVVSADPHTRAASVRRLADMAADGVPEAANFVGFASEYGLFGMHKDPERAAQFYAAAARSGYQPALYNLAVSYAYGRVSAPSLERAAALLQQASAAAVDRSYRVCGLAAFVNFRLGRQAIALEDARDCGSPLAALPQALGGSDQTTQQQVESLRRSIATGADDGYSLLEAVTMKDVQVDTQYTYCKYALVNRYRHRPDTTTLRDDARRCVDIVQKRGGRPLDASAREQAAAGITGFVIGEVASLKKLRDSNKFRYSLAVPYLPFAQQDVDLYARLLPPLTH